MKFTNAKTHYDLISELYKEAERAFQQVGGIAPSINDLYHSENWRYCSTEDPKLKGKVGYICAHEYLGDKPRVRITVHSFAQGGQSAYFDSWQYEKEELEHTQVIKPVIRHKDTSYANARLKKEQAESERKHQLYLSLLKEWENGSPFIFSHPYVISKGISEIHSARLVSKDRIAYPLVDLAGNICGLQTIDAQGNKRIHGKKKGNFVPLGNLKEAQRIYLCEGYATACAVEQLVKHSQKRQVPVCIVAGIDNKNLETVADLLKSNFKNKKLIICPDNDHLKIEQGKNNAGLLSGYSAALNTHSEIKIPPSDFPGSDWCDAWLAYPTDSIDAFAQTKKIKRLDYALERISCFGQGDQSMSLKKACVQALRIASTIYPSRLDESELLTALQEAIEHTAITKKDCTSWWRKIKRRCFGQAMRAKSVERQQKDNVHTIYVRSMQDAYQQVEAIKENVPEAIFITNAPMGVGKTKEFIQPQFLASDLRGELPVIITPTKSLTKGVSERLHASHYIDDSMSSYHQGTQLIPNALAITINSIISRRFNNILTFSKTLFIDEYTQVLRAIVSGTVENHQRIRTETRLAQMIQQSHYTYIADADFNQVALNQIQDIVQEERPIYLFMMDKNQNERENTSYHVLRHSDPNFPNKYIIKEIEEAVDQNQRLYIVSDSKSQLEIIETTLQANKIDSLMITADNVNFPKQKAFLDQPDAYLNQHQPQVVLASPAIQSGVSIEANYFHRCFGLYTGTVAPSVFQQMLHRVRAQTKFEITLPHKLGSFNSDSENALALLVGAYQQHIEQFGGVGKVTYDPTTKLHTIGQISLQQQGHQVIVQGDDDYIRFETLAAQMKALDNQQTNNAANYLLIQAICRGVSLNMIDIAIKEHEKNALKVQHKLNKQLNEQELTQNILEANVIDQQEYQAKSLQGGATSPQHFYETTRFEIADVLNKTSETLTATDIEFYQNHGPAYVANYQTLLQGAEKAREHDTADKKKGVAKVNARWRKTKVKLLSLLFNQLGINIHSGDGCYDQVGAQGVRAAIKDDAELSRYVTLKLNLTITNNLSDTAFVNKIFKKLLGLKTLRRAIRDGEHRYWEYQLNPLEFQRMKNYQQLKFNQEAVNPTLSPEKVIY